MGSPGSGCIERVADQRDPGIAEDLLGAPSHQGDIHRNQRRHEQKQPEQFFPQEVHTAAAFITLESQLLQVIMTDRITVSLFKDVR